MVLLALQKAFDIVAHSVLLMKLKLLVWEMMLPVGLNPIYVTGNNLWIILVLIQKLPVSLVGYPKALSLDLFYFSFILMMSAVTRNKLLLYADDSSILVANKSRSVIEKELSDDLQAVSF